VRVPFALPPGGHNEAQLQFLVNSISMPQKLKGTITYVAKVTDHTVTDAAFQLTSRTHEHEFTSGETAFQLTS